MHFGQAGCQGILLGIKRKDGTKAIYGYYEGDEIVIVEDDFEQLKKLRQEREEPFERNDNLQSWLLVLIPLCMIILCIIGGVVISFKTFLAMGVFTVLCSFPLLVLIFANMNSYKDKETHEQMKRFHGCEHAVVKLCHKNEKEPTYELLKSMPIYDSECGTVYSGYAIFLGFMLALMIINPMGIGFFKAVGLLALLIILLFFNVFNPYNPFKLLQKPAVAMPTDYEYKLGWEMYKKLSEIKAENK